MTISEVLLASFSSRRNEKRIFIASNNYFYFQSPNCNHFFKHSRKQTLWVNHKSLSYLLIIMVVIINKELVIGIILLLSIDLLTLLMETFFHISCFNRLVISSTFKKIINICIPYGHEKQFGKGQGWVR